MLAFTCVSLLSLTGNLHVVAGFDHYHSALTAWVLNQRLKHLVAGRLILLYTSNSTVWSYLSA